MARRALNREPS